MIDANTLRVAILAGSLFQGGAEKQLVYMAKALHETGVDVRIYSLTHGEFYESELINLGLRPIWVGQRSSLILRLITLLINVRKYNPHILQSGSFFPNLYVSITGKLSGTLAIGSIRNDTHFELENSGKWGPWLLKSPPVLLANSETARNNAISMGVSADRIYVLPNVIDLDDFDQKASLTNPLSSPQRDLSVYVIARLVPQKRVDRFIAALAIASQEINNLRGVIVGDGSQRSFLEEKARQLGLFPDGLFFLGQRKDVPALLRHADMLMLTSDHEGFPNVLLEAMAACVPVITTPAGDAGRLVQDGDSGYIVDYDDIDGMAQRLISLARSPALRRRLGRAGRKRVEDNFNNRYLADRLKNLYLEMLRNTSVH